MENNIPTANDFIPEEQYYFIETLPGNTEVCILKEDVIAAMISFAKYHITRALEAAAQNSTVDICDWEPLTDMAIILKKSLPCQIRPTKVRFRL